MIKDKNRQPKLPGFFSFYCVFVKPFLFLMDAESAHNTTMRFLKFFWRFESTRNLTRKIFFIPKKNTLVRIGSVEFSNPVGLAAGFDKNAELLPGIDALGFGFVEIGTVTPRPQEGNARPRISREPQRRAVVNRMGFPNLGADIISAHLKAVKEKVKIPIGVNIGKNKDTPNTDAALDYEKLLLAFQSTADYFTVNISSPNTPGLRALQSSAFLMQLSRKIEQLSMPQPIFIKLAPDLLLDDLKEICTLCGPKKPFTGLVLTNTMHSDLGGISGWPLKKTSFSMLVRARSFLDSNIPIISVGGIESADDVRERLKNGATAVQIYTTLIYQGPAIVRHILRTL